MDATEIKPIADKVQAIVNFPKPFNMRHFQCLIIARLTNTKHQTFIKCWHVC